MKLAASLSYPAPPSTVLAMLLDREFQELVCVRTGATSHQVAISETSEGGRVITTTRVLPADGLPDFVRSFAGPHLTVRRTDTWQEQIENGVSGHTLVEILGTPVRFTGQLSLIATELGTREELTGELKAAVPLLGKKIEQAAAVPVERAIAEEGRVGQEWLAERG